VKVNNKDVWQVILRLKKFAVIGNLKTSKRYHWSGRVEQEYFNRFGAASDGVVDLKLYQSICT
jgi:hypothetical protein